MKINRNFTVINKNMKNMLPLLLYSLVSECSCNRWQLAVLPFARSRRTPPAKFGFWFSQSQRRGTRDLGLALPKCILDRKRSAILFGSLVFICTNDKLGSRYRNCVNPDFGSRVREEQECDVYRCANNKTHLHPQRQTGKKCDQKGEQILLWKYF